MPSSKTPVQKMLPPTIKPLTQKSVAFHTLAFCPWHSDRISKGNFGLATEANSHSSQKPVTLYLNLSRFSCWTTRWLYRFIFVLKLFWQPTTSHCNNNDNTKHHGALQHQTCDQYCNHCISKYLTQVLASTLVDIFFIKTVSTTQKGSFLGVVRQSCSWGFEYKLLVKLSVWEHKVSLCGSNCWCLD